MHPNPDTKISANEAAARIGIRPNALAKLRGSGEGPPFFKVGPQKVVYSVKELDAWMESRRMTKTPGGPGGRPRKNRSAEPQRIGA